MKAPRRHVALAEGEIHPGVDARRCARRDAGAAERRARKGWPRALVIAALLHALGAKGAGDTDPLAITVDLSADPIRQVSIAGAKGGDELGSAVASLGDVDGDGAEEFAFYVGNTPDRPYALLVPGRKPFPERLDLGQSDRWALRLESERGEWSIWPQAIGDLDRDGLADFSFLSRPDAADPRPELRVFFGGRLEPGLLDVDAGGAAAGFREMVLRGSFEDGRVPTSCLAVEADGDGIPDLLVAMKRAATDLEGLTGKVFLIRGSGAWPDLLDLNDPGLAFSTTTMKASAKVPDEPDTASQNLGTSLARIGDLNGDGCEEFLVSAPGRDLGEEFDAGAAFLVWGRREWPEDLDLAEPGSGVTRFLGDTGRGRLGERLFSPGDFNGDGLADLALSALNGKALELVWGRSRYPEELIVNEASSDGHIWCGVRYGSEPRPLIIEPAAAGDLNGDGLADLALGIPYLEYSRAGISGTGCAYILLGNREISGSIGLALWPPHSIALPGHVLGALHGQAVAAADVDGDGFSDLVIGAPGSRVRAPDLPGAVRVIFGGEDFRGALEGRDFAPLGGRTAGGTRVVISGRGFSSRTTVSFGSLEPAEYRRIDSRTLVVITPQVDAERKVEVALADGDRRFVFPQPFLFSDRYCEVYAADDLEWRGLRIVDDGQRWHIGSFVDAAGDIDGDGRDDLFFANIGYPAVRPFMTPRPGRLYILYGRSVFPEEILMSEFEGYGTEIYSGSPNDWFGDHGTALGDFDGDGRGDLACFAGSPDGERGVFVILGGPMPPRVEAEWRVWVDRKGMRVRCPSTDEAAGYRLARGNDVNGDGLCDLLIGRVFGTDPVDGATRGTVSVLLGRRELEPEVALESLPVIVASPPEPRFWGRIEGCWGVGDVDGDGCDDIGLAARVPEDLETGQPYSYGVWLLFGRKVFPARLSLEEEGRRGGAIRLATGGPSIRCREMAGGDVDGDGFFDLWLAVATIGYRGPGSGGFLILGGERRSIPRDLSLGSPIGFDAHFSWVAGYNWDIVACAAGGDFDGDGLSNLILADEHALASGPGPPGRAFVIAPREFGGAVTPLNRIAEGVILEDGWFAYPEKVAFCGDINGDGIVDMAAGASGHGVYVLFGSGVAQETRAFRRGDANQNGRFELGDPIFVLTYLFANGAEPPCLDAADANDSGALDLADPIFLLNWLFAEGSPPPPPHQACGPDPTADDLTCRRSLCR